MINKRNCKIFIGSIVFIFLCFSGILDFSGQKEAKAVAAQIVNFNTKGNATTNYTEVGTGYTGYTNGAFGADAAFLGTYGGRVRFMLSGVIGEVAIGEVALVNFSSARSVSYYAVSGGRLLHYITTNVHNTAYATVLDNGNAPSYLAAGVRYYSYDGHYFYTNYAILQSDAINGNRNRSVNPNDPFYNYFQYLPFRSRTNHSAQTMETRIAQTINRSSVLTGKMGLMLEMQEMYGVNALLALAVAGNESAWGTSNIAITKNNAFGLNAVDSSPGQSANYYPNVDGSIRDFMETYMSKQYLNPQNWKYAGAFLGNKGSGVNIRYASDPYWGEKAASIAWSIDRANGNKDAWAYLLGIKDTINSNHTNLNIRANPNTNAAILYNTKLQSNHAFIVLSPNRENNFYKIQSEPVLNAGRTVISTSGNYNFANMYAYASAQYLRLLSSTGNVPQPPSTPSATPSVRYRGHVQDVGWQGFVQNGATAGTSGQSRRIEALEISLANQSVSGGISYRSHVQDIGWQGFVQNGAMTGTSGRGARLEAIEINLTGEMANAYDIYYRTHVQELGWLDWAKNGQPSGSAAYGYRMEALQIVLVAKGGKAPGSTQVPFRDRLAQNTSNSGQKGVTLSYNTHVQNVGWMNNIANGGVSGTTGSGLRMEAIRINLAKVGYTGGITYRTHVQNMGWLQNVGASQVSGTSGKSLRLEAIVINLTGDVAADFDIYYRTHCQDFGWLGWAKNGQESGTQGRGKRMEAIEIRIVPKNAAAPGRTNNVFIK